MLSLEDDLDAKIAEKLQELESLENTNNSNNNNSNNKRGIKDEVEFKVPKPRVKRAVLLNATKSNNRIQDNIRYHLDGLKSASEREQSESLNELLLIAKDYPELMKPFLNEICSVVLPNVLLIVVLVTMNVLKIEAVLEEAKGMSLIQFNAFSDVVLNVSLVEEYFEEFGKSLEWNDLMVWLLSRYCMSCEVQGRRMPWVVINKLKTSLELFSEFGEKSQEVISALVQFWLTQDHQAATLAIASSKFTNNAPFKKILITATGFTFGSKLLFEKGFFDADLLDDLDVTIAINLVDRFPQHRLSFMSKRKAYVDALDADPTNQKLALLVGFLHETDATKVLEPGVHAAVKAACKTFLMENGKHLDDDSLLALQKLLKSL